MVYSYEEAVQYILNIPKFTRKNPMDNTRHFMECLGNPQDTFKTIHVAGTNGKGSVCAMLAGILAGNGYNTGLFTSPHLVDINERIRINGEQITNEEFADIFNAVLITAQKMKVDGYEHPTFFEFIYGMCMVAFRRHNVEYAVVEAGMGGKSDTTNIVSNPVVTIITSIGLDHTEFLGETIALIAEEKSGIIKEKVPVVFCGNDTLASDIIRNTAERNNSPYTEVSYDNCTILKKEDNHIDFSIDCGYYVNDTFRIPFIAEYQVLNAAIALCALGYIEKLPYDDVYDALENTVWEGRMEQVLPGFILDGAHNEPGILEFIKTANSYECNGRKLLLFSAVKDKDYDKMIRIIAQNVKFDGIYVTQILGKRCLETAVIADEFRRYQNTDVYEYDDNEAAFDVVMRERDSRDIIFCCGSLYLAGSIKSIIRRKYND